MKKHAPVLWLSIFVLIGLGLTLAAGCGGHNVSGPSGSVPLTLRAGGTASTSRSLDAAGTMGATSCNAPVTYSQVLMVVRDVKFQLAENDSNSDSGDHDDAVAANHHPVALDGGDGDGGDDDQGEDEHHDGAHQGSVTFHGPFVVDLLSHTADSLDTQLVPPGDYRSVDGHIAPLQASDWNASQFDYLVGFTVYIQGTVEGDGGGDFTYKAPITHRFKIRGDFHVESATPATAFLVFDTSQWFCSRDGQFLDPRDPANDLAIRSAIIRSLRIGMDDDHDGRCDDRTHGEGD